VPVNYKTRASLTGDIEWDAHIQGPMAEDPDTMTVWRDLTLTVCWVLLSLLGFPDTVPTHDREGKQLTREEYKDLAIEMEHMYRKCKGTPTRKKWDGPFRRPSGECARVPEFEGQAGRICWSGAIVPFG
jgi:hypothetical protein